ncbi:MAG TPA: DUF433 domain-containing protein [Candidatus Methylomirabilis sp.]|jgi:uncharacterized protein (DUF433 family)
MRAKTYAHIASDPGVCGGAPRVRGTRITVAHIAEVVEHLGVTPDDVVALYPSLDLGKVHAALSYYHDHRRAIEAEIRRAQRVEAGLRRRFPPRAREVLLKRLG